MKREHIKQQLEQLMSMKLPLLNKKSRLHHDWKLEIKRLTNLLNETNHGKEN